MELTEHGVDAFRSGGWSTSAPFAPSASHSFKQKGDQLPKDARREPGGKRWAWIERECDDRGGGHGVVVSSVCVLDPARGELKVCYRLPSPLEMEVLPEPLLRDPREQATRILSKVGKIYVAGSGAGTCSYWNVRPISGGSAEISMRDDVGDIMSYVVEVSSARDPFGEGHPALIWLGPNSITKRKGVLGGSIGSGEQTWLGQATRRYVDVGSERWFFDLASCLRTIAEERSREGSACGPTNDKR